MKKKFDNYESLYALWDFSNTSVDYLDDITNGNYTLGEQSEKRLKYAREHLRLAALALFPVAYNGIEKKYL